jgi:hypothetical protein
MALPGEVRQRDSDERKLLVRDARSAFEQQTDVFVGELDHAGVRTAFGPDRASWPDRRQWTIEAEAHNRAAEQRRVVLLRRLVTALAVFSALAVLGGVVAVHQYSRAVDAQQVSLSQLYASQALNLAASDVGPAIRRALDA